MNQIILLEKQNSTCSSWKYLIKHKRLNQFSVEEIVKKYKGFEGDFIFSYSFESDFNKAIEKYELLSKENVDKNYYLFCVCTEQAELPEKFEKVGYDFGTCDEGYTVYSSIFNEILFGNVEELINYKNFLNDNLLFPKKELAREYAKVHHDLLIKNRDVEHDEYMKIYEICAYKNR